MTTLRSALSRPWPPTASGLLRPWLGSAAVLVGLAGIVGVRRLATTFGLDALAVGAAFGLALAVLWLVAARPAQMARVDARRLVLGLGPGVGFGVALVLLAIAGAAIGGSPIVPGLSRPAAPFLSWAAITIVVAAAQEGILRGILFDRLRAAGGLATAVAVTTLAFALMHVPLYGWHVVPLDLAVGLGLAGLRLSTRTVIAPVAAHATADIATWWL